MIIQNSMNTCPKKVTEQKISLFNILTCLICTTKAKMAHICPNCSKFFCEECIKKWIQSGNQYCPNCKNYLNQASLVNCNKLSQDLSSALEALIQLQTPQQSTCQQHSIQQTYFCQDCKYAICSDCIVLQSSHRGHNVLKLKKIKMDFNQQILFNLSKIRKCIKEIQKNRQQTIALKNNNGELLKAKIEKFLGHMQRIKTTYQNNVNDLTIKFDNILQGNKLMQMSGQKIYQQFASQVKQMSKIALIQKNQDQFEAILLSSMQQIGKNFLQKQLIKRTIHNSEVANLLKPKFAQKTFVLYNYTQFRDKKDVIYSDAFFDGPLQWRLKIYPNGLQKKKDGSSKQIKYATTNSSQQYISIYIQLVAGVRQGARYQFNIEIINQTDPSKIISQVYQADFDNGKCWGYDEFANIATLYQKGYIHPQQDSLKISVSVGPPSYFYSTLDQQAIINTKEQVFWRNAAKIEELKNMLKMREDKTTNVVFQKQNPQFQIVQAPKVLMPTCSINKLVPQQTQDIRTPRNKLPTSSISLQNPINTQNYEIDSKIDQKKKYYEQSIDFERYVVEAPKQEVLRHNEQFDYQSAELRKIFRRVSHMNDRSNLLMF